LFVFASFVLLITACAPEAAATEEPVSVYPDGQSTQAPVDLPPAASEAITVLSENLGLSPDQIRLVSAEEVEWPDGCLGVQEEGVVCTDAITPGFRIILEANGREVEYRTNEDGTQIRPATVLMTWKREGGIAGFCDHLIVYLSGEVHRSSCRSDQHVEGAITHVLSEAEIAKLDTWIERYGEVYIDASDPKAVSDRMVVMLDFRGVGKQETISAANERELLDFAQSLHQKLNQ
jgi:hypothetical protein